MLSVYQLAAGTVIKPPATGSVCFRHQICSSKLTKVGSHIHTMSQSARTNVKCKLNSGIHILITIFLHCFSLSDPSLPLFIYSPFSFCFLSSFPPSSCLYSLSSQISVKFPSVLVMFVSNAVPTKLQVSYSWLTSINSHSCVRGQLSDSKVAPSVCVCVDERICLHVPTFFLSCPCSLLCLKSQCVFFCVCHFAMLPLYPVFMCTS